MLLGCPYAIELFQTVSIYTLLRVLQNLAHLNSGGMYLMDPPINIMRIPPIKDHQHISTICTTCTDYTIQCLGPPSMFYVYM